MTLKIRKAAVLGAGVMGAQIAAHLAAAGVQTYLFDLPNDKAIEDPKLAKVVGKNIRNAPAVLALHNLAQLKPAPLASRSLLSQIIPGNFEDDMAKLAEVDWVIEAVIERIDIKKSMLRKIAEHAPSHIPITTNTSGLGMAAMCEDMADSFKSRFFGTHFFNPPRYMKLLEIVPHAGSDKSMIRELSQWIEKRLGKGIVNANDTINFIANRIGVFNIQATFQHMEKFGLNVETVDALTGKLMGRPASATLRTMDVVGIDTFVHVAKNVYDYAPEDPFRDWFLPPEWIETLVKKGHLGQKAGAKGAYLKSKNAKGKTEILAYRPSTDSYEEQAPQLSAWMAEAKKVPDTIDRIGFILDQDDDNAKFFWSVLRDTFAYSALLLEEIASGKPLALDNGMKWGFNWEWGPFQLWQGLGYDKILKRMQADGVKLPKWLEPNLKFYNPQPNSADWHRSGPKEQYLADKKKMAEVPAESHLFHLPKKPESGDPRTVLSNRGASLLDLGDGVACLSFHSKMNAINSEIVEMIRQSVDKVEADFRGLVIGNDGDVFSAGADLREILGACKDGKFEFIDSFLQNFQNAMQSLKYASFPSVSCPQGLILGGGCEVSLHTSKQLIANDSFAGLVEVGVGLIPAGGGTKELALRAYDLMGVTERGDPMPFLQRAFMLIGMGRTSTSGLEAIEMGLYGPDATMMIARDHQIAAAKAQVLAMTEQGYRPPIPKADISVVGDPGIQTFKMMLYNMVEGGQISEYDAFIGSKVATVLCGGDVDGGSKVNEQFFLDLERKVFVELCREQKTQDRIEHMLKNGKPLRN